MTHSSTDTPQRPTRPRRHRILAVAGLVLLAFAAIGLIWLGVRYAGVSEGLKPVDSAERTAIRLAVDPVMPAKDAEPVYVLILGSDARQGQTRARSDTMMLARLDTSNHAVSLLSIPRDSRVPVAGHGLDKITHANAYGGPALAIKTVKDYTGLPVNHFVELNFIGFAAIVDAIGGVRVTVDQEINDRNGLGAGSLSDVTHIPAGTQTLDSAAALTFVRSRAYPDGDFTRIKNQQKFIVAFAKQALASENLFRLSSIAQKVADNMTTDMSIPQLLSMAADFRDLTDADITRATVPGSTATINGVSYVIPDEAEARVLFEAFRGGL